MRLIYISVQSMMQAQFLKKLKHAGRFSLNTSLSGQIISSAKILVNFGNQVLTILDTYSSFILNLKDRSRLLGPSLSFIKIRRRWLSMVEAFKILEASDLISDKIHWNNKSPTTQWGNLRFCRHLSVIYNFAFNLSELVSDLSKIFS